MNIYDTTSPQHGEEILRKIIESFTDKYGEEMAASFDFNDGYQDLELGYSWPVRECQCGETSTHNLTTHWAEKSDDCCHEYSVIVMCECWMAWIFDYHVDTDD